MKGVKNKKAADVFSFDDFRTNFINTMASTILPGNPMRRSPATSKRDLNWGEHSGKCGSTGVSKQNPNIIVALPFAYRDGVDKYVGIMRFLRESGIDCELRIIRETLGVAQFRRYLSDAVSGVICGKADWAEAEKLGFNLALECLDACSHFKIPLVGLDWPIEKLKHRTLRRCSFLNIDSTKVGALAAEVLMESGEYATFGFVGAQPDVAWSCNRGSSFVRRLRKAGHRNIMSFEGDVKNEEQKLLIWLKSLCKPAAIFAANDYAADVVLRVCMRNGLRVPGDLSVLGVDDDPVFCVHTRPTLSSIHPDFEEMGYLAAQELFRLMSNGASSKNIVVTGNPTVTHRMSTAPSSPDGALIRRADEIISARACQDLNSELLAAELKISRRLLDLRYRQQTGRSVRESIVLAKIDRAKRLLAYSSFSIGTISRMCGYRTESYLGTVFRAHEGVTMSEYRSMYRDSVAEN